jgi:SlyX protein
MTMSESEYDLAVLAAQLRDAQAHITALELGAYRQQQQIDLLQGQLRKLYAQMQGGGSADGSEGAAAQHDSREDIPPHY